MFCEFSKSSCQVMSDCTPCTYSSLKKVLKKTGTKDNDGNDKFLQYLESPSKFIKTFSGKYIK